MKCRHCGSPVNLQFLDLGSTPPSNSYLTVEAMRAGLSRLRTTHSNVVEIAANDGYLLQYVQQKGIPCLGVEPTASTAKSAHEKEIGIVESFFGVELAKQLVKDGFPADLTAADNVLAHVPDINDFVAGFAVLLKPNGTATLEFPHLLRQVQENQFDTVYHEHFSYLSLTAVCRIFERNGLAVTDVEELPTHGSSLHVHAQRKDCTDLVVISRVGGILDCEQACGMTTPDFYRAFQEKAITVKNDLLSFLLEFKRNSKRVAA